MDSEIVHPHGNHNKQEVPVAGLHAGEDREHNEEKKSVLKKVKAKAKKIKENLMHGHGHNEDHLHRTPDDHDVDEEEDDDEDEEAGGILHDPEIPEASPVFEPSPVRNSYLPGEVESETVAIKDDSSGNNFVSGGEEDRGLNVAVRKMNNFNEVPDTPLNTPAPVNSGMVEKSEVIDPIGSSNQKEEVIPGRPGINLEGLEEDPHAPKEKPEDYSPSNYQSKVADVTGEGRQELGVPSILRSFDKMTISSEVEPSTEGNFPTREDDRSLFATGSRDQISTEPIPAIPVTSQDGSHSVSESTQGNKQGTFSDKISSVSSAIANKAISVTNIVVSKLKSDEGQKVNGSGEDKGKSTSSPVEYGKKIAANVSEKLGPVSSSMMSKVPGIRSSPGNEEGSEVMQDKGVSIKDYFADKLRPGDEDRALSEVISETLSKQKQPAKKTVEPMGKVSGSNEVQRPLGSNEEKVEDKLDRSSVGIPGSVMLETGEETGERRLQESRN